MKLEIIKHSGDSGKLGFPPHIDPITIRIKIPLPLSMWDQPSWNPLDASMQDIDDEQEENNPLIIGNICERSGLRGNMAPLFALRSFDEMLGKAVESWCNANKARPTIP